MRMKTIKLDDLLDPVNSDNLYGFSKGLEIRILYNVDQLIRLGGTVIYIQFPTNGAKISNSFMDGLLGDVIRTGMFRVKFDEIIIVEGTEEQKKRYKEWVDAQFAKQSFEYKILAKLSEVTNWFVSVVDRKIIQHAKRK